MKKVNPAVEIGNVSGVEFDGCIFDGELSIYGVNAHGTIIKNSMSVNAEEIGRFEFSNNVEISNLSHNDFYEYRKTSENFAKNLYAFDKYDKNYISKKELLRSVSYRGVFW